MLRVMASADLVFVFTDIEGSTRLLRDVGTETFEAVLDVGLHRVRDFEGPVRLLQVAAPGLAGGFPPVRAARHLLMGAAMPTTPLVGREAELRALADLLPAARLVTLVGTGGVGKSRLA